MAIPAASAPTRYEATCPECGQTFTSQDAFRAHGCAQKKHRCSACGARFEHADDLTVHAAYCPKR